MGKNKEDYNFKEQQNRFKDFDITEEHSSEEAYEYCKFLYHKELKNNIAFKNRLILTIPLAVFQICYGASASSKVLRVAMIMIGMFLLYNNAYYMGKCSEWNKRNEQFLRDINEARARELTREVEIKVKELQPK